MSEILALILGFGAGVLHVFAGPDHLAAGLAVRAQRPGGAWYYGGVWALGHAAGLSLIGLLYFFVRETGFIAGISEFAERMVGVALILMGAWMLLRRHQVEETPTRQLAETQKSFHNQSRAAMGFGVLHGTAGATHLLGLVPMFALQDPLEVLAYLLAYNGGILVAMSGFCFFVGVLCQRTSPRGQQSIWGLRISASAVCLIVGSYWLVS